MTPDENQPRGQSQGDVKTDARGEYEFRTILRVSVTRYPYDGNLRGQSCKASADIR